MICFGFCFCIMPLWLLVWDVVLAWVMLFPSGLFCAGLGFGYCACFGDLFGWLL